MRKHVSQMTTEEKIMVRAEVEKVKEWRITAYANSRANHRVLAESDILAAIHHGKVIEYNRNKDDKRVLLRGTRLLHGKCVVCVVVSLTDRCVVTAYVNKENDVHRTLNWELYDESINIATEMEEFKWGSCNGNTLSG